MREEGALGRLTDSPLSPDRRRESSGNAEQGPLGAVVDSTIWTTADHIEPNRLLTRAKSK
jgi:hypothetical protein